MNHDERPRRNEPPSDAPLQPLTPQQSYNVVTDLVAGPNVRLWDNLVQGITILVCLGLGVVVGFFLPLDHPIGLIVGGIGGVVVGLLGSGLFLMIYRAVRHMSGKHD
jgi:hypothetical protein